MDLKYQERIPRPSSSTGPTCGVNAGSWGSAFAPCSNFLKICTISVHVLSPAQDFYSRKDFLSYIETENISICGAVNTQWMLYRRCDVTQQISFLVAVCRFVTHWCVCVLTVRFLHCVVLFSYFEVGHMFQVMLSPLLSFRFDRMASLESDIVRSKRSRIWNYLLLSTKIYLPYLVMFIDYKSLTDRVSVIHLIY